METICMKCQILFSGKKNKKNIINVVCLISPEGMVKINSAGTSKVRIDSESSSSQSQTLSFFDETK